MPSSREERKGALAMAVEELELISKVEALKKNWAVLAEEEPVEVELAEIIEESGAMVRLSMHICRGTLYV